MAKRQRTADGPIRHNRGHMMRLNKIKNYANRDDLFNCFLDDPVSRNKILATIPESLLKYLVMRNASSMEERLLQDALRREKEEKKYIDWSQRRLMQILKQQFTTPITASTKRITVAGIDDWVFREDPYKPQVDAKRPKGKWLRAGYKDDPLECGLECGYDAYKVILATKRMRRAKRVLDRFKVPQDVQAYIGEYLGSEPPKRKTYVPSLLVNDNVPLDEIKKDNKIKREADTIKTGKRIKRIKIEEEENVEEDDNVMHASERIQEENECDIEVIDLCN